MTSLGLPVPQGFTITTEACTQYYEDGREINEEIRHRSMSTLLKWKRLQVRSLATARIASRICSFRSKSFYAWYDGYNPEPWIE